MICGAGSLMRDMTEWFLGIKPACVRAFAECKSCCGCEPTTPGSPTRVQTEVVTDLDIATVINSSVFKPVPTFKSFTRLIFVATFHSKINIITESPKPDAKFSA